MASIPGVHKGERENEKWLGHPVESENQIRAVPPIPLGWSFGMLRQASQPARRARAEVTW